MMELMAGVVGNMLLTLKKRGFHVKIQMGEGWLCNLEVMS